VVALKGAQYDRQSCSNAKRQTRRREWVAGRGKYDLRRGGFVEGPDVDLDIRQSTHVQVDGGHDVGEVPEDVARGWTETGSSVCRLLAFPVHAAELGDVDGQIGEFHEGSDAPG